MIRRSHLLWRRGSSVHLCDRYSSNPSLSHRSYSGACPKTGLVADVEPTREANLASPSPKPHARRRPAPCIVSVCMKSGFPFWSLSMIGPGPTLNPLSGSGRDEALEALPRGRCMVPQKYGGHFPSSSSHLHINMHPTPYPWVELSHSLPSPRVDFDPFAFFVYTSHPLFIPTRFLCIYSIATVLRRQLQVLQLRYTSSTFNASEYQCVESNRPVPSLSASSTYFLILTRQYLVQPHICTYILPYETFASLDD